MILTDKNIRALIDEPINGKKLIENFQEESLQSESYDLSIGNTMYRFKDNVCTIDLDNQEAVDNIYQELTIPQNGCILSPGEYVLVSLHERINLPDNITAHVRPRTRFTRLGLIVVDQHCNSSYSGVLKIGLYNATKYAINIKTGLRIIQILFEELKEIPSSEKLYRNKPFAIYHNETDFIGAQFPENTYSKIKSSYETLSNMLKGEK